ncbi:MAG: response regulator transcription factor [Lachnospiraceae bacterium]|nr:response regulator transcription factor [Lachnospiraceae bacterium]
MRILVVEDERDLNRLISDRLKDEQYIVDSCYDGNEAYEYITNMNYDGIILDIMLDSMDGFTLLKKIRYEKIVTPIMILSAKDQKHDIIYGLDQGADDYMVKPFDFEVLLARLRAMLRKSVGIRENCYRVGDLEINVNEQTVVRAGKQISLTPKEYSILLYMVRNQNIVLSREQIELNIWELDKIGNSNVVDVFIRYLRKKIDDDFDTKLIHTVRGVGYSLSWDEDKNEEDQ